MHRWPTPNSATLRRSPTSLRNASLLCVARRPCDVYPFLSSLLSRNREKSTEDSRSGGRPGSSGYPPDTMEGNATRFLDTSGRYRMSLDGLGSRLKEHANSLSSAATLSLAEIGGRLNKVTGYEHIEALKRKVVENEAAIVSKRQASRDAKLEYETAVARRSNSQREVNDLLQRKSSWTDADLSRFTVLVREDHLYEQDEVRAKNKAALAEAEVEVVFNELMRTILNRYHEEQIWSDKIRSASTYGSLLALSVNIIVFFLAIVVVEPWKRRRLSQGFEKRIEELSLENRAMLGQGMSNLAEHFQEQEQLFAELVRILREIHPDNDRSTRDSKARPSPQLPVSKGAKAARDRNLWIAGASGLVGGSVLMFLMEYFR